MVKQVLLVGLGGAVGSILRFLSGELVNRYIHTTFPYATFAINIVGCFCIGALTSIIPVNSNIRFLLIAGFCGGFTTFSTFAKESYTLANSGQPFIALIYVLTSCLLGILAVWLGIYITK